MIDVYWWSRKKHENAEFDNFGDILVPFILEKTTTQKFRWVKPNTDKFLKIFKSKHYFIIGSIIRMATSQTIVWGAGIIKRDVNVAKCKFLAVRGPLTREILLNQGHNVPEVYGDPAILLSLFHKTANIRKKYKYALVPHYVDYEIVLEHYKERTDIKIINLSTNNPEEVIDQILECENIISSSLHGIIVSHALKIPAIWMEISENIYGDNIKYYDYYLSLGINNPKCLNYANYSIKELDEIFLKNKDITLPNLELYNNLLFSLVKSFPFKKSKGFKNSIKEYFEKV
jgi:hypothetical protein